jgi:hypothetical protein
MTVEIGEICSLSVLWGLKEQFMYECACVGTEMDS